MNWALDICTVKINFDKKNLGCFKRLVICLNLKVAKNCVFVLLYPISALLLERFEPGTYQRLQNCHNKYKKNVERLVGNSHLFTFIYTFAIILNCHYEWIWFLTHFLSDSHFIYYSKLFSSLVVKIFLTLVKKKCLFT